MKNIDDGQCFLQRNEGMIFEVLKRNHFLPGTSPTEQPHFLKLFHVFNAFSMRERCQ